MTLAGLSATPRYGRVLGLQLVTWSLAVLAGRQAWRSWSEGVSSGRFIGGALILVSLLLVVVAGAMFLSALDDARIRVDGDHLTRWFWWRPRRVERLPLDGIRLLTSCPDWLEIAFDDTTWKLFRHHPGAPRLIEALGSDEVRTASYAPVRLRFSLTGR